MMDATGHTLLTLCAPLSLLELPLLPQSALKFSPDIEPDIAERLSIPLGHNYTSCHILKTSIAMLPANISSQQNQFVMDALWSY